MKKLMKVLVLVTVLAMMFAGLQVAALADEEGEDEEAPEAATTAAEDDGEEAPAESAAAATGNPETGATTPFAVASFGAILLAAGAVPVVMKKK